MASNFRGSKVWLISMGAKAKLQPVIMTIAQQVNFELVPVDASASGFADAHVTANVLAETILNLAELDRSRLLARGSTLPCRRRKSDCRARYLPIDERCRSEQRIVCMDVSTPL